MADIKKESELLAEIYRNTHYALVSISDILPETEDEALQENGNIGFIRRHAGKGTVLMFDGHAEMRGRKSSQLKISFAEDGTPQDDREKP